jgi:O-antigen ligase
VQTLTGYLKTGPAVLFTIAGLTTNWRQCRGMMWALALAASVDLATASLFEKEAGGRLGLRLEFGSIQNANDFAAHLLLLLPFLVWVVLSSRFLVLRLLALPGVVVGFYLILRTASRGAALAMIVAAAFFLWRATTRQRIAFLVLAPLALAILLAAVPRDALTRMRSFSADEAAADISAIAREAAASGAIREYLFRKGITYALEHPLFGVGPGQFSDYEGSHEQTIGTHGYYRVPHNSFTQVASECGIPALLLFVAGIVSTLRLLNATYREARRRPDCQDIGTAAFCVMLAIIGFCTATTFLSSAYAFQLPGMAGLAIAVARAAKQEFAARAVSTGAPEPPWAARRQFAVGGSFGAVAS